MTMINMTASRTALTPAQTAAGQAYDHLSTVLNIALDTSVQGDGYTYRLLFETADGYSCMSELLTPDDTGSLTFALPNVLMVEGMLQVQLIVYEGDAVIAHTPKCAPALEILPSITAVAAIPEDYTGIEQSGVGIASVDIVDGHLIVTYEDGRTQDAGAVGALGEWRTRTRIVEDVETEVEEYCTRGSDDDSTDYMHSYALHLNVENKLEITAEHDRINMHSTDEVWIAGDAGTYIRNVDTPTEALDAVNKQYVDGLVGDIETALDSILAMQEALIGGEA